MKLTKYIILACFILLLLSISAFAQSPKIELINYELDLGYIKAGPILKKTVEIKNIGDETLIISKLHSTCDCATVNISDDKILPHKTAALTINLDTEELEGNFRKYIYIQSNDPNKPIARVIIKGQALKNSYQDRKVEISLFYSPDCKSCREIEIEVLGKLKAKYGQKLIINKYDTSIMDNYAKLVELENKYKITKSSPMVIFLGDTYLLGKDEIKNNLERTLEVLFETKNSLNLQPIANKEIAEDVIINKFKSFSVLAILSAGLIDGINPCAFSVIVFLISFLTCIKKTKKEILLTGIFFSLAVFLTYLLLGLGAFKVIRTLSIVSIFSEIIYYLAVFIVFGLALYNLYDLIAYLITRNTKNMKLQLPLKIKNKIHSIIQAHLRNGKLVLAVLVVGFLVSLLESVCTGQVYLPTIIFMTKDSYMKYRAYFYLILYNLMFIIPLVCVTILTFLGVKSESLVKFSRKNLVLSKGLLVLFFFGLGLLMLLI